jgi:restriction endonuclease Mrr
MNISTKYLIECKRYAPNKSVGIEFVQRLFGVKMAERANKAILATTSCFTKPAIEFANNNIWDLELKDYSDIVSWLSQFGSQTNK